MRARLVEKQHSLYKLHANYGRVFSEWSAIEREMGDGLQVFFPIKITPYRIGENTEIPSFNVGYGVGDNARLDEKRERNKKKKKMKEEK